MKKFDLKLVCEPISNPNFMDERWVEKEIGVCIPFGRHEFYKDKNKKNTMKPIVEYLRDNPPHLSSLRFTNLLGGEPAYIKVTPSLEREDDAIWDRIYQLWPSLLKKIKGENICYLDAFPYLPEDYDGKIIKGLDGTMPLLFECTPKLLDTIEGDLTEFKKSYIWYYNTRGYILPEEKEYKLTEWRAASECTLAIVKDFFDTIVCCFEVRYEREGIGIVSHKLDWQKIYNIVEVDKVNKELNPAI
jgi:hypothetical protein